MCKQPVEQPQLSQFFNDVDRQLKLAERRQQGIDKLKATKFNVFDLIEPDENKLSDILGSPKPMPTKSSSAPVHPENPEILMRVPANL